MGMQSTLVMESELFEHTFSLCLTYQRCPRGILANSEDPDEMQQKVAFHQGGLLKIKTFFRDRNKLFY